MIYVLKEENPLAAVRQGRLPVGPLSISQEIPP